MQVIHKKCSLCKLHKSARTVCINGFGAENPKIIVFLDNPPIEEDRRHKSGISKYAKLVIWLFKRMSIDSSSFRIEYTLRCHAEEKDIKTQKDFKPKVDACSSHQLAILQKHSKAIVIGMGKLSCYALLGSDKHGDYEGMKWSMIRTSIKIKRWQQTWITYSPAYAFQTPSETPRLYRVLFAAAEEAGLNPLFDPNVKPFDFDEK